MLLGIGVTINYSLDSFCLPSHAFRSTAVSLMLTLTPVRVCLLCLSRAVTIYNVRSLPLVVGSVID